MNATPWTRPGLLRATLWILRKDLLIEWRTKARLNALQDRLTIEQNDAEIGQIRPVLFHYESGKYPDHYYGRTEHFRLVRVQSSRDLTGQLAPVRITHANKTALLGELA